MRRRVALPIVLLTTSFLLGCNPDEIRRLEEAIAAAASGDTKAVKAMCGEVRRRTSEENAALLAVLRRLPRDHAVWTLFRDAEHARDAIRICRGEGLPAATKG